jgi:O-antigen biosynthesis protein
MGRLLIRGKYIYEDGHKFLARGVSYGPFAPNSRGDSYPELERVAADFALMREMGTNLVRTYVVPPPWLFEQAAKHELRLMVGIPWPFHLAFLDSREMVRDIRSTMRRQIGILREFNDTIFAYSLGNEVRADIVRWHGPRAVSRFIAELYDIGKQLVPEGLFTYSNYPSVEYLDLSFLDVISFNVYLHREPDFRRYLTHLMAITGDRPLILSETGMDTIREGEQHQAELLQWQSRASFELGLSGLVVFAFTDEWFTGGVEITEWAFGLTTRARAPKPSFAAVAEVFRAPLPPALTAAPKASVIVPAFNTALSLGRCLESLARLNYPEYEVIVVDDGSTDSTAAIAEAAGVRTLKLTHRGLAAARNAGLAAARGEIVAYIDADAEADRDWLYHLSEALTRRNVAAVGGQNFAPAPASMVERAIAAAPGQPAEVRLGDQDLAQLCGCSMAIARSRVSLNPAFDLGFTTAGDDVDFSWRLRGEGLTLAHAPGAVVIHRPRPTIRTWLRQQRGYGNAEGLLFRKYQNSQLRAEGVYGSSGWMWEWFGGSRIYHGAFGRGLFQSLYKSAQLPLAVQLPLMFHWFGIALLLALAGAFDPVFGVLGIAGLLATVLCACLGATASSRERRVGISSGVILVLLWLLGPLIRSWEREHVKWSFHPDRIGAATPVPTGLSGSIELAALGRPNPEGETPNSRESPDIDAVTGALHLALVRRGLAVAKGTAYDTFDLQIIVAPFLRVSILFLNQDRALSLGWRSTAAWTRAGITAGALFILLLLGRFSFPAAALFVLLACTICGMVALLRAREIPAVISAGCADIAEQYSSADASQAEPQAGTGTTD